MQNQEILLNQYFDLGIKSGLYTGAQAVFGNLYQDADQWRRFFYGRTSGSSSDPVVSSDSKFDLASLTKPLATSLLVFRFQEIGLLKLDQNLSVFFVGLQDDLGQITLRELLNHTSGLSAWVPFYKDDIFQNAGAEMGKAGWIRNGIYSLLEQHFPGPDKKGKTLYSDLNFMWLCRVIEKVSNERLDLCFRKWITGPTGFSSRIFFRPLDSVESWHFDQNFCELETLLESGIQCDGIAKFFRRGQVHDDNAFGMQGVSGHAGLFGDAESVAEFLKLIFERRLLSPISLNEMTSVANGTRAMGWDKPSPDGSGVTGRHLNLSAVGHLGFAGGSMWLELATGKFAVLLTNRRNSNLSPESASKMRKFRIGFHDIVF